MSPDLKTLFVPMLCHATLMRVIDDKRIYVEGPRLLRPFFIGSCAKVGSVTVRTFGNDWWETSNIMSIEEINYPSREDAEIVFKTLNSTYSLIVPKSAITYRDDLDPVIFATENLYDSDPEAFCDAIKTFLKGLDDGVYETKT